MIPRFVFIGFASLLAMLAAAGCDREGPDAAREGNDAFASERYGDAREAYDRALKTMPDRPELDYNSGNTLYREERFAEAGTRYDDAFPDAERLLARDTAFNSGNAQLEAGNLEEAIELYKQALRIDPSDQDAKHNLELALEELEEQQPENEGEEEQEDPEEGGEEGEQEPQPGPGEPQPDDQQGQQDQQQGQQDENEGQEGNESDGGENEQPSDQQPSAESPRQQEVPPTGLTEEEARRLLDSVPDNTLQDRIRRRDTISGPRPEREW